MNRPSWMYKAFNGGFTVLFGALLGVVIFAHKNQFLALNPLPLVLLALLLGAALAAAALLWDRRGRAPRREKRTVGAILAAYYAVQLALGLALQVLPRETWDFPKVFYEAQQFVLEGTPPSEYFALFGNNAPLYWVFVGLFRVLHWFGVTDFMPAAVALNCALINLTLWFVYRTVKLLWGAQWALAALLAAMLFPALLLYGPILYTDTLALPAVAAAVYYWLRARGCHAGGERTAALRNAVLAFGLIGAGAVMKISVAILAIAFLLDGLLFWPRGGKGRILAAAVACMAVLLLGGNWASRAALPEYEAEGIPFTHWIMMGLQGDGSYWDPDYQATLSYDTYAERADFTRAEILRRLREKTIPELLQHCANKLSLILSDGTCYAPSNLDSGPKQVRWLHRYIIAGNGEAGLLYYAADALQLCLLAGCMVSGWRAFRTRREELTVLRVGIFGLLLFLLIWEASSRYLLHFWPLLFVCGFSALVPAKAARCA